MLKPEQINFKEIPLIAEVQRNEAWLLGERVGHPVDPKCSEVVSKVAEIILKIGNQWRKNLESELSD